LFEGLAIAKADWEWKAHPIIHIGFGHGDFTNNGVETLAIILERELDCVCSEYGISVEKTGDISDLFVRVITGLTRKVGRPVVIIDEYDNPLLATINQPELNEKLREKLKGFYSVIKQYGEHIRFAFITGVTKFAQVSVFSGMNQPQDISMMSDYCDICGVTQEELEKFFAPEIDAYSEKHGGRENYLKRLREFYNGYCFTKERIPVYNTYGLLNHFENSADFAYYWSMTGAPSFLLKYLEMRGTDTVDIEEARMEAGKFGGYKDNTITLFPLLYQAGYLTISDYDENTGFYRLNYPNIEVRKTLAVLLSDNYSNAQNILNDSPSIELINALLEGDIDEFMNTLKWYLQTVDYSLSSKITEFYVEFAVSNVINMLGLRCINEVHTASGRMDSVIHAGEYIYIIEFKVDKPVETALRQIKRRDYALVYAREGKKIVKVGVAFSREARNIVTWEMA
jgi:hypothetical protein